MSVIVRLVLLLGLLSSTSVHTKELIVELDGAVLQGSLLRGKVMPGSKVVLNEKPIAVSDQGDIVFGFSRDETQTFELTVTNGTLRQSVSLTPKQRDYRIQRIDGLEQSKVTPPKKVLERIRNDAVMVRKARAIVSSLKGFKQAFIWPSEGVITGVYGSQRILNGTPSRPHFGVDLAAPTGTKVVAPAGGKITMAHPDLYYSGGTIVLDHGLGLTSTFIHLNQVDVTVGDVVEQGQKIGEIGETGRATGPHLDWRINWLNVRLDPALLVSPKAGLDYTSETQ